MGEGKWLVNLFEGKYRPFFNTYFFFRNKAGLSDASNIIYLKTNGETSSPLTGAPANSVTGQHTFVSCAALFTFVSTLL